VVDETGRERERYGVVYGARLMIGEGDVVTKGLVVSEWDPFTMPILSEAAGKVRFGDMVEGLTCRGAG